MPKLHVMAQALIKYETLDAEQIDDIMGGREPRPPEGWNDMDQGSGSNTVPVKGKVIAPEPDDDGGLTPASQH